MVGVLAEEGDEAAGEEGGSGEGVVVAGDAHEGFVGGGGVFERDEEDAVIGGELSEEGRGDFGGGGGDEDAVEGWGAVGVFPEVVGPAAGAVAGEVGDVGVAHVEEAAVGGGGEGRDAFDGEDVSGGTDEVCEDGGLVAGAGAELEDAVAGLGGEFLGHDGDNVGLGDGLSVGGGEGFVGISFVGEFVGDEEVAGDFVHGVEDGAEDDSAAAEVELEHVLAGGVVRIGGGHVDLGERVVHYSEEGE